jgi:hypothetical protein
VIARKCILKGFDANTITPMVYWLVAGLFFVGNGSEASSNRGAQAGKVFKSITYRYFEDYQLLNDLPFFIIISPSMYLT